MAVSILHRISGSGLALVGLAVLTWWLVALAKGAEAYADFAAAAAHPLGRVVMIGLSWAYFQHLLSGVRHLFMDSGSGFELPTNKRFAMLTIVGALILTAALWVYILEVRP